MLVSQVWQSGPMLSGYVCPVFRQPVTQNNIHTKTLMCPSGPLLGYAWCVQTARYPEQHTRPKPWCDSLDHCASGCAWHVFRQQVTVSMAINSKINVHSPTQVCTAQCCHCSSPTPLPDTDADTYPGCTHPTCATDLILCPILFQAPTHFSYQRAKWTAVNDTAMCSVQMILAKK